MSTQKLIDSRSVGVPRIWNVLSHLNKRVAVVGVPLTYPVEWINGVMIGADTIA
jgi:predicted AlkP superfamily phosphohydrolase/phosphomutase